MVRPTVTVVVVAFNHSRFVLECLASVEAQMYPELQVIIVDDASTDGTADVIADWLNGSEIPVLFLRHDANIGLTRSLNEALGHATGDYVAYISADDVMVNGRLTRQAAEFEALPDDVAVLYSDAYVIDEDGVEAGETYGDRLWWFPKPPEGDVFVHLLRLNFICAPAALMRRRCIEAVGRYDESLLLEDWDMWLRLSRRFDFRFSPVVGVRYRDVGTSVYHTRRAELAKSKIQLLHKWLDDPVYRPKAIARLRGEIHHLYDLDRKASLPYLRRLCELQPGWRSQSRYLLARAGVSRSAQRRLVGALARRRNRDNVPR